jgi:hypothetical protein
VPIKPEQLAALLDALREAGKAELHLAVSPVGLFGLRPAELGVHRVDEGRLYVGNVKRNARTLKVVKPERRALPLDLPGREVEGTKAMALLRSGLVKLPGAIRTQAAEGAGGFSAQISRFQHILPRCTVQINCSGSGLTFTRRPHLRSSPNIYGAKSQSFAIRC